MPPTYISVGGLDLFLEENLTYADRLSRAGVPVELHMYPRAYHGFYRATNARVTRQAEGPRSALPLRRVLPEASFLIRQLAFDLGGGSASRCPKSDLHHRKESTWMDRRTN